MIRIRRLHRVLLPVDIDRIEQVKEIFRDSFRDVPNYADKIPELLNNPFKYGYSAVVIMSETAGGKVTGFSLVLDFPEIKASMLDYIAVKGGIKGGGIGSALYEATREYVIEAGNKRLYMEVLPDDPKVVRDPALLEENRRRLRFYEHYGVRPVIGTKYETAIGDSPAPYLLVDLLGRAEPLRRDEARSAVRLILIRKYSDIADKKYIDDVVNSFTDDPIRFREPRYVRKQTVSQPSETHRLPKLFALIASESHRIHHVRDRGYVERPARIDVIVESLNQTRLFDKIPVGHFGEERIKSVHDPDFVAYLKRVCTTLQNHRPVYPYVFPVRRPEKKPKELAVRAGYYCIDTFTPLDKNAYNAAKTAVDVALTGVREILQGRHIACALCRPPGHHAGKRTYGGFCYFNNAAISAQYLSRHGRVAVLDIDYHHGNGTQDIFYNRSDVITISIHGHPNHAYPYFSGFADENGEGDGKGFNRNYPLPENCDDTRYFAAFNDAISLIKRLQPVFLVVSLGFDIMKGDPTGDFMLSKEAIYRIGQSIALINKPTLIIQEGGYNLRNLRAGAKAFFSGIASTLTEIMKGRTNHR